MKLNTLIKKRYKEEGLLWSVVWSQKGWYFPVSCFLLLLSAGCWSHGIVLLNLLLLLYLQIEAHGHKTKQSTLWTSPSIYLTLLLLLLQLLEIIILSTTTIIYYTTSLLRLLVLVVVLVVVVVHPSVLTAHETHKIYYVCVPGSVGVEERTVARPSQQCDDSAPFAVAYTYKLQICRT